MVPDLGNMSAMLDWQVDYGQTTIWENDQAILAKLRELFHTAAAVTCGFCGNNGHPADVCGTKKTLTALARDMGIKFNFGMMKGVFYDEDAQLKKQLARAQKPHY